MPVTEQGGCGASAALSLGGSESDLRLDRLSARAKQAGGRPPRGGSLPTRPDQKQVGAPPIIASCRSLWEPTVCWPRPPRRPPRRHRLQPRVGRPRAAPHRRSPGRGATRTRPAGRRIFGPQHGFRSDVQENMIETRHARDALRRVPVYSLYSETREPTAEMLRDLDVLVVDLQDVGTRIYTYIYTMANCLVAARKHGIKVIVCDRPESDRRRRRSKGRCSCHGFESFVGLYPIPMRHGMTIGELARLFNEHVRHRRRPRGRRRWTAGAARCTSTRPACRGCCRRRTSRRSTRRSSIPGTVLFEGTNVSEGRGTTRPFELLGAPWVDAERFADGDERARAAGRALPAGGHSSRRSTSTRRPAAAAARFTCSIARRSGRSKPAWRCIAAFRAADPDRFRWRDPPYEYEHDKLPIDILAGSSELREQIEARRAGARHRAVVGAGRRRLPRRSGKQFLLY